MHKERLLNVAKALRESKNPEDFSMAAYAHCGTPACALGHYAARTDLQDAFKLIAGSGGLYLKEAVSPHLSSGLYCAGAAVCEHFGAIELFHDGDEDCDGNVITPVGCGNPATALAAAEYIERFVAEHGAKP
jgi:hypothetical protein